MNEEVRGEISVDSVIIWVTRGGIDESTERTSRLFSTIFNRPQLVLIVRVEV